MRAIIRLRGISLLFLPLFLFSLCAADEPVILYTVDDETQEVTEYPATQMMTSDEIKELNCRLYDFQPQEATVSYMLNFCQPIQINSISEEGVFTINPEDQGKAQQGESIPFLEGCNTLSITSVNRMGFSNRQTIIIKMFNTPARVDVVWPWVNASIIDETPIVIADIYPIYGKDLKVEESCVETFEVNGTPVESGYTITPISNGRKINAAQEGDSFEWTETDYYQFRCNLSDIGLSGLVKKTDSETGKPFFNTIKLSINPMDGSSKEFTKPFTNNWGFYCDQEPPKIAIFGERYFSPAESDKMDFRLRFNDNLSLKVRDLRVSVENDDGREMTYLTVPWQGVGEADIHVPMTKRMNFLWRLLRFWAYNKEQVLPDGNYTLRVRCRDMALINPEHVEHEYALQQNSAEGGSQWKTISGDNLFEDPDYDKAVKYIKDHFDENADPRFNVGEACFPFVIDSRLPRITDVSIDKPVFTSYYKKQPGQEQHQDHVTLSFNVDEPAYVDVMFRRVNEVKAGEETRRTWVSMYRKIFWAENENGDESIDASDVQKVHLDFSQNYHLLPDGIYDIAISAEDSAGNKLPYRVYKKMLTIDRTGPVITQVACPGFILSAKKIADSTSLTFTAFDSMYGGDPRKPLGSKCNLVLKKRGSSEQGETVLASLSPESDDKIEYAAKVNLGIGTSEDAKGVYDLQIRARDDWETDDGTDISNLSTYNIELIYGTIPPEIRRPMEYSEVSGTVIIKGIAKDPEMSNNIPFGYYSLAYAAYDPEDGSTDNWESARMRTPAFYGRQPNIVGNDMENTGTAEFAENTGKQQVTDAGVLGYWQTAGTSGEPLNGYYKLKLTVYETGDNASSASTEAVVFVYNSPSLNLAGNPKLTLRSHQTLNFLNGRTESISFGLNDPAGKTYNVTLGIRNENKRIIDTLYTRVSGGGVPEGRPSSTDGAGIILWKERNIWHLKWNSNDNAILSGILSGNGEFTIRDAADAELTANNNPYAKNVQEALLSNLIFKLPAGTEVTFRSDASRMELQALEPAEPALYIGANGKAAPGLPHMFYAGCEPDPWVWDGKDLFGTWPPPGKYQLYAVAEAEDGMGFCEASQEVQVVSPFGVSIDHISSDHFYRKVGSAVVNPDSVTAWYKLVADADVSVIIIDENGNRVHSVKTQRYTVGRSEKAKMHSVSWSGNRGNVMLPAGGPYRFLIIAASPGDRTITASDTSGPFTIQEKEIKEDLNKSRLAIVPDQIITKQEKEFKLLGGRDDFVWMAKAKGKSFPNQEFSYKLVPKGRQTVYTAPFQRHTVKIRRYFKRLNFKIFTAFIVYKGHPYCRGGGGKHTTRDDKKYVKPVVICHADSSDTAFYKDFPLTANYGEGCNSWLFGLGQTRYWKIDSVRIISAVMPKHEPASPALSSDTELKRAYEIIGYILDLENEAEDLAGVEIEDDTAKYNALVDSLDNYRSIVKDYAIDKFNLSINDNNYESIKEKIENYITSREEVDKNQILNVVSTLQQKAWYFFDSTYAITGDDNKTYISNVSKTLREEKGVCWEDRNKNGIMDVDSSEVFYDRDSNEVFSSGDVNIEEKSKSDIIPGFVFYLKSLDISDSRNDIRLVFRVELEPEVWECHYAKNNLVNRYSTWDSENSLYYSLPGSEGGYIDEDGYDNDDNGEEDGDDIIASIDPTRTSKPAYKESDRRYSSILNHQRLKLAPLIGEPLSSPPLKFFGLEKNALPSGTPHAVENEAWQIWIEGHPDGGTYDRFTMELKNGDQTLKTIYSHYHRDTIETSKREYINISNSPGEKYLEIWPSGLNINNRGNLDSIGWPLTYEAFETYNGSDRFLHFQPPGTMQYNKDPRQRMMLPHDSLQFARKDSALFEGYYQQLGIELQSSNFCDDTLSGQGIMTLHGEDYYCNYHLDDHIDDFIQVKSVQVHLDRTENTNISYRFLNAEGNQMRGGSTEEEICDIQFYPTVHRDWTSEDDPLLDSTDTDPYNSKDDNGNLLVDEDSRGVIRQSAVYGDDRGFKTRKQIFFHDGYPEGETDTLSVFSRKDSGLVKNDYVNVSEWDVSIRDVQGYPNPEYEILEVYNGEQEERRSYFTTKLKDDVFFPRRLVQIHGVAQGEKYRIYFRNGDGWDRIAEATTGHWNDSTMERTLGFWDVTGLNGQYTVALEVLDGGESYQDEQIVHIGQYADESNGDRVLYGQNGRSVLTLPQGALSDEPPEDHIVTFSAIHMDEVALSERPEENPAGPVIRILPSKETFPEEKYPKVELYFTGPECARNGWLHQNFALYSIGEGGVLNSTHSLPTYVLADPDQGYCPGVEQLANADAFAEKVQENTECFMKITGEVRHWSNYMVKPRDPVKYYVDAKTGSMNNSGENWKCAFSDIKPLMDSLMFGDSVFVSHGMYSAGFTIPAGVHVKGGYHALTRTWNPANHPSTLRQQQGTGINMKFGSSLQGFRIEGFGTGIRMDSGTAARVNRCLLKNNGAAVHAKGGSKPELIHCTIKGSRQNKGVILQENAILKSINTIFDCPTDIDSTGNGSTILFNNRLNTARPRNYTGDPQYWRRDPLCHLTGGSPMVDMGKKINLPYIDEAPDIGWHEYVGDTLYVNQSLPLGANTGRSWRDAFTGGNGLAKAISAAGPHSRIFVAGGDYSSIRPVPHYLVIKGGYDPAGSGKRSPYKYSSIVNAAIPVTGPGAVIDGLVFKDLNKPAIDAEGVRNLHVQYCRFKQVKSAVRVLNCGVADLHYNVIVMAEKAVDGEHTRIKFFNNTVAYGVKGVSETREKPLKVYNNIFYNLSGASVYSAGSVESHHNCFFGSPPYKNSNSVKDITNDPLFVNPQGNVFYLDSRSPCLYTGKGNKHIGALGSGQRARRVQVPCSATDRKIYIDGNRGSEWIGIQPVSLDLKVATCGNNKPFKARAVFAYDKQNLYGYIEAGAPLDAAMLYIVTPSNDTLSIALTAAMEGVKTRRTTFFLRKTYAYARKRSGAKDCREFSLEWKKAMGMDAPAPDSRLEINIAMKDAAGNIYLWTGGAGCIMPPMHYARMVFSDEITPRIEINGLDRYNSHLLHPEIKFVHATSEMKCRAELNGEAFVSGSAVFKEGRHTLRATIKSASGRTLADTLFRFVVDFRPPDISVPRIPPFYQSGWDLSRGPVPVINRPLRPSVRCADQYGVRSVNVRLNGVPYPVRGRALAQNGVYYLTAEAVDSSGNRAQIDVEFEIDSDSLRLNIQSPADSMITNQAQITIQGTVNHMNTVVRVEGTGLSAAVSGSTFTVANVPLQETGLNAYVLRAFSSEKNKWSNPETLHVFYDTLGPVIAFVSPQAYDTISSQQNTVHTVRLRVTDDISASRDLQVTVNGFPGTRYLGDSLSDSLWEADVILYNESMNYGITAAAADPAGNRTTEPITFVFGKPPVIVIKEPAPYSFTKDTVITITGSCNDSNASEVFVNNFAVPYFDPVADSFSYTAHTLQGIDTFIVRAIDAAGFTDEETLFVFVDRIAPACTLKAPASDTTVLTDTVYVRGTTDDPNAIIISGSDTLRNGGTSFVFPIPLRNGDNTISLKAVDSAGNSSVETRSIIVRYENLNLNIIYVNGGSTSKDELGTSQDPYKTIAAAVSAASAGTEIRISAYTYSENVTLKSGLKVSGGTGVIVSPSNTALPAFTLADGDTVTGIRFTATNATAPAVSVNGGSIYVNSCGFSGYTKGIEAVGNSSLVVTSCTFSGNTESAISASQVSAGQIRYCDIRNNGNYGINLSSCSLRVLQNIITDHDLAGIQINSSLKQNQVLYNTLAGNATGVEINSSAVSVKNNIVSESGIFGIRMNATSIVHAAYNDVWSSGTQNFEGFPGAEGNGDSAYIQGTVLRDSLGNFSADPMFSGTSDYQLQSGSPCLSLGEDGGSIGRYGTGAGKRKAPSTVSSDLTWRKEIPLSFKPVSAAGSPYGYAVLSADRLYLLNVAGKTEKSVRFRAKEVRCMPNGNAVTLSSSKLTVWDRWGNKVTDYRLKNRGTHSLTYDLSVLCYDGKKFIRTDYLRGGSSKIIVPSVSPGSVYALAEIDNGRIACAGTGGLMLYGSAGEPLWKKNIKNIPHLMGKDVIYAVSKDEHSLYGFTVDGNQALLTGGLGSGRNMFDSPCDISAGAEKQLVVSDAGNHRLVILGPDASASAKKSAAMDSTFVSLDVRNLHFVPSPYHPKSGNAWFSFELTVPADVTIRVFDGAGRTVRTLTFDGCQSGINQLVWDGRNGIGKMVVQGPYMYVLKANNGTRGVCKTGKFAVK